MSDSQGRIYRLAKAKRNKSQEEINEAAKKSPHLYEKDSKGNYKFKYGNKGVVAKQAEKKAEEKKKKEMPVIEESRKPLRKDEINYSRIKDTPERLLGEGQRDTDTYIDNSEDLGYRSPEEVSNIAYGIPNRAVRGVRKPVPLRKDEINAGNTYLIEQRRKTNDYRIDKDTRDIVERSEYAKKHLKPKTKKEHETDEDLKEFEHNEWKKNLPNPETIPEYVRKPYIPKVGPDPTNLREDEVNLPKGESDGNYDNIYDEADKRDLRRDEEDKPNISNKDEDYGDSYTKRINGHTVVIPDEMESKDRKERFSLIDNLLKRYDPNHFDYVENDLNMAAPIYLGQYSDAKKDVENAVGNSIAAHIHHFGTEQGRFLHTIMADPDNYPEYKDYLESFKDKLKKDPYPVLSRLKEMLLELHKKYDEREEKFRKVRDYYNSIPDSTISKRKYEDEKEVDQLKLHPETFGEFAAKYKFNVPEDLRDHFLAGLRNLVPGYFPEKYDFNKDLSKTDYNPSKDKNLEVANRRQGKVDKKKEKNIPLRDERDLE